MDSEKRDISNFSIDELRKRAEDILKERGGTDTELADARQVFHELQVYQIELELQNDELLRIHDRLEASSHRLRELYDLAPLPYLSLDKQGVIININITGTNYLGSTRSYLLEKPMISYIQPEYHEGFFRHIKNVFQSGGYQTEIFQMRLPDNRTPHVKIHSVIKTDFDNNERYSWSILSDVSDVADFFASE
jgi:PAS domain S-box-containing protein